MLDRTADVATIASPILRSVATATIDGGRSAQAGAEHEREAARDRCRPAQLRGLPLVFRWRAADKLGEPAAERAQAAEADRHANLGHCEVDRTQQVARALDPAAGPVPPRRLSVCRIERTDELAKRVPGLRGQGSDIELLGEVAVDPVPRAPQRPQAADRRAPHS